MVLSVKKKMKLKFDNDKVLYSKEIVSLCFKKLVSKVLKHKLTTLKFKLNFFFIELCNFITKSFFFLRILYSW